MKLTALTTTASAYGPRTGQPSHCGQAGRGLLMGTARLGLAALVLPAMMPLAAPAQAAPDRCTWTPNGNHSTFHQNNNLDIQIDWGPGAQGGTASYAGLEHMDWKGPVQGGVEPGTNKVDFTVQFQLAAAGYGGNERPPEHPPTNRYTGSISDSGHASGSTTNDSGASNTWTDTGTTWNCVAQGFQPGPNDPPGGPLPPADQPR